MGNCLFGGLGDGENEVIKVITSSGGIMEFYEPTTAESITDEFPGHVIFRSHDLFWNPIPHNEMLLAGNSYYLLPLPLSKKSILNKAHAAGSDYAQLHELQIGHVRSKSRPPVAAHCSSTIAPYRMSFEHCSRKVFKKTSPLSLSSAHLVARGQAGSGGFRLCKQNNRSKINKNTSTCGIWKVKLVISPEQLAEILSQEIRTQELIESVRTVAKCGSNYKNCVSSSSEGSAISDLWGLSVSTANPRN